MTRNIKNIMKNTQNNIQNITRAGGRQWLRYILCGALIGAGAMLPGVSGGVLAVAFGIYRPFIEILTHPKRGIIKYKNLIPPLAIGWMIGFWGIARGLAVMTDISMTVSAWLFIGLIAGTMPVLYREAGKNGHPASAWYIFIFCLCALFGVLYYFNHIPRDISASPGWIQYGFCGILCGLGIIIPGLTSSAILISLGLYQPMLQSLSDFDWPVLLIYLTGMGISVLLMARVITWLFRKYHAAAFHGILGIVAASTASMIPLNPRDYRGANEIIFSVLCAAAGFVLASRMARMDEQIENQSNQSK